MTRLPHVRSVQRGATRPVPSHGELADPARAALTALFDLEFESVYRFCLARSGSHSIADEVTSDVFLEAAREFGAGRTDLSIGWLITVARRRIIDRWRAQERRRQLSKRVALQRLDHLDAIPEPDESAILDALQSLPERQRLAVALRYLDGYSVAEVAEALEVSYSAAESLLSRGRSRLAAALEEIR